MKQSIYNHNASKVFQIIQYSEAFIDNPSGVCALPLAAGRNEGGHYFRYIFPLLFFLPPLFKTTEGVVVGFHIFAWAPKKK